MAKSNTKVDLLLQHSELASVTSTLDTSKRETESLGSQQFHRHNQRKQTWRTPTRGEEGTSPKMWIDTVDIAIDSGLILGLTE